MNFTGGSKPRGSVARGSKCWRGIGGRGTQNKLEEEEEEEERGPPAAAGPSSLSPPGVGLGIYRNRGLRIIIIHDGVCVWTGLIAIFIYK